MYYFYFFNNIITEEMGVGGSWVFDLYIYIYLSFIDPHFQYLSFFMLDEPYVYI